MQKIDNNPLFSLNNNEVDFSTKKLALVLFHGLAMHAKYLSYMGAQLSKKNYQKHEIIVLNLKSSEKMTSVFFSIKEQAKRAGTEIKKILQEHHIDLRIPIFLIGHSQGGIRGLLVAQKYSDELNIVGIVTLASPLEGVPFLTKGPQQTIHFVRQGQKGLQKLGFSITKTICKMVGITSTMWWISRLIPGLRDLRPQSKCLNTIKVFFKNNKTIPIFLVAGEHNDLNTLYHKEDNDEDITLLSKLFEEYITHEQNDDKHHDTLIPVSSQIAINTEGLLIKRKIIKRSLHASNLIVLCTTTRFLPPQEQQELLYEQVYDPHVIDEMYQFISSVLFTPI